MKRYILTGAPGSGKTTLINSLAEKGYTTIAEAVTDLIQHQQRNGIEEPWFDPNFMNTIVQLQLERIQTDDSTQPQFYDRSPICTYALAVFLKHPISEFIYSAISTMIQNNIYNRDVFFIDSLSTIEQTNVRRLSLEQAIEFGEIHIEAYTQFGFNCIHIEPDSIEMRVKTLLSFI